MKNKNICKIVEDLLPAYIDALLSEESKKLVEEHLETCETCQKAYSQMTSDIQKEVIQNTENVKTIKKYRRKIKILKLFVILCILLNKRCSIFVPSICSNINSSKEEWLLLFFIAKTLYIIEISISFMSIQVINLINFYIYTVHMQKKAVYKKLGKSIKSYRELRGLTQEKLAKLLNVVKGTIGNYESARALIATPFLYTICKKYYKIYIFLY